MKDRVEVFLGGRLRGLPVPADLRRLVEMQLDGELDADDRVQPFWEIRVLAPGEAHSLEKGDEPPDTDPRAKEIRANNRAIAGVLAHIAPVVSGFNGDLWGYWLHPDEPAAAGLRIVKLDTEGQFSIVSGAHLVEAMIFDWAGEDDVGKVAAYCDRHRLPLAARSASEVHWIPTEVSPAVLHEKLFKRAYPYHVRPEGVDEAGAVSDDAPIGARADDPRVAQALARHGFPEDLTRLIQAADLGDGEVVLRATACTAVFELHREDDTRWFLHQMQFFDQRGAIPACAHGLPFGFRMDENQAQWRARLGEPGRTNPGMKSDQWRIGRVRVVVFYDGNGMPRAVRCMAALGND